MLYKNGITGEIAVDDWGCTGMQVTGKKTNRLHSESFDVSVARWSICLCMCVCMINEGKVKTTIGKFLG